MGSITVPNKNGDFISIVSSEEKVTSTPQEMEFPGLFLARRSAGQGWQHRPRGGSWRAPGF